MKSLPRHQKLTFLLICLLPWACQGVQDESTDPEANLNPNPTAVSYNYIALGDSLAAGVQDAHTNRFGQVHSYPAYIARQLRRAYETEFIMPLMDLNSTRTNPDALPTLLGISGETAHSLIYQKASAEAIDGNSSITERTLFPFSTETYRGKATSQLDAALYLAEAWKTLESDIPRIITLFIGNNEILGAIVGLGNETYTLEGIRTKLTPPEEFHRDIQFALERLAETGANIFVATLPNTLQIAYLVRPTLLTRWTQEAISHPLLTDGAKISLAAALQIFGDYQNGLDLAESLEVHLTDASVMNSAEQQIITEHLQAYNESLKELSAAYGFTLVDLHEKLRSPQTISGIPFSEDYGFGKFFSLDGVHFSHTGHAHTANLFLEAMNEKLGAQIPLIPLSEVHAQDPYRDADGDGFPAGPDFEPLNGNQELVAKLRDPDDNNAEVIPDLVDFP